MSTAAVCVATHNQAVFTYDNMPFIGACVFKNKTLFCNNDGLFEMGGITDNGTRIVPYLETAAMDNGTQQRKRVPTSKVYIDAEKQGGRIDLEVTVDGKKNHYNSGDRERDAMANYPIKVGRGADGVRWKFKVSGNSCNRLSIGSIEFEPEVIRRRA